MESKPTSLEVESEVIRLIKKELKQKKEMAEPAEIWTRGLLNCSKILNQLRYLGIHTLVQCRCALYLVIGGFPLILIFEYLSL